MTVDPTHEERFFLSQRVEAIRTTPPDFAALAAHFGLTVPTGPRPNYITTAVELVDGVRYLVVHGEYGLIECFTSKLTSDGRQFAGVRADDVPEVIRVGHTNDLS